MFSNMILPDGKVRTKMGIKVIGDSWGNQRIIQTIPFGTKAWCAINALPEFEREGYKVYNESYMPEGQVNSSYNSMFIQKLKETYGEHWFYA